MLKIILCFVVLSCGFIFLAQAEQIELKTYYPSPQGVYQKLRLVPIPEEKLPDTCETGTLLFAEKKEQDKKIYTLFICVEGLWGKVVTYEGVKPAQDNK
ncbi:MAG: hypothetical protein HQL25_03735 [Candidatus Omnitrophica bacterium]|nr:hypothetical protein [Candidatus Omnitrophota bacterium]